VDAVPRFDADPDGDREQRRAVDECREDLQSKRGTASTFRS